MRAQDHSGVEVISKHGEVLLGWLMNLPIPHASRIHVRMDEKFDVSKPFPVGGRPVIAPVDYMTVDVVVLNRELSRDALEDNKHAGHVFRQQAASYAEQFHVPETNAVRLTWTALSVTPGQHEGLFDMDAFLPAELGGPDYESARFGITPGVPETMARLLTR